MKRMKKERKKCLSSENSLTFGSTWIENECLIVIDEQRPKSTHKYEKKKDKKVIRDEAKDEGDSLLSFSRAISLA